MKIMIQEVGDGEDVSPSSKFYQNDGKTQDIYPDIEKSPSPSRLDSMVDEYCSLLSQVPSTLLPDPTKPLDHEHKQENRSSSSALFEGLNEGKMRSDDGAYLKNPQLIPTLSQFNQDIGHFHSHPPNEDDAWTLKRPSSDFLNSFSNLESLAQDCSDWENKMKDLLLYEPLSGEGGAPLYSSLQEERSEEFDNWKKNQRNTAHLL